MILYCFLHQNYCHFMFVFLLSIIIAIAGYKTLTMNELATIFIRIIQR